MVRLQESREPAQAGKHIEPRNILERLKGSATMDNERYKRCSGEMQVTKSGYPEDERVEVIGRILEKYHLLLKNGAQFMFAPETNE
ncbi:phospho-sugar glycosidase domain-containing protein [Alkalibacterium sp. f15]|uniref:phospho-sugar glycosidase domain-containing protein n=1 Tax=Alkalibacterium sp. f15 TaxID=3414029 RepID=UPI003BF809F2